MANQVKQATEDVIDNLFGKSSEEIFVQRLRVRKEVHDKYLEDNKDKIEAWKEAVVSVIGQMREWLQEASQVGLVDVDISTSYVLEGAGVNYCLPCLVIKPCGSDFITLTPYVVPADSVLPEHRFLQIKITSRYSRPGSQDFVRLCGEIDWVASEGWLITDKHLYTLSLTKERFYALLCECI